ncbi:DUF2550 domain-containing protein [Sanguibacter suaedae]|uniref:DUF2550 domain-containing protein n=1 Tax=Sanguibacter suaedae TaxID=2795737 RepID=UPI0027DAB96C|nr:DUF2550 domain-containing protein [Sanguibacter suaedae]
MDILLWSLGALLVGVLLVAVAGFLRLRALSGYIGSFESSVRLTGPTAKPDRWRSGFAVYRADRLVWWRARSLRGRPRHEWSRELFVITGRVPLDQAGQPDLYLVQCRCAGQAFDLTMSSGAYSGLASWLESAPPNVRNVVV